MNADELRQKASTVAYAYKKVYGNFPDKIGVHVTQRHLLPCALYFPALPEINTWEPVALKTLDHVTIHRHEMIVHVVMGVVIVVDEVYVVLPGTEDKVVSGRCIEMLAQEFVLHNNMMVG